MGSSLQISKKNDHKENLFCLYKFNTIVKIDLFFEGHKLSKLEIDRLFVIDIESSQWSSTEKIHQAKIISLIIPKILEIYTANSMLLSENRSNSSTS